MFDMGLLAITVARGLVTARRCYGRGCGMEPAHLWFPVHFLRVIEIGRSSASPAARAGCGVWHNRTPTVQPRPAARTLDDGLRRTRPSGRQVGVHPVRSDTMADLLDEADQASRRD
jgi:hypothetical protein